MNARPLLLALALAGPVEAQAPSTPPASASAQKPTPPSAPPRDLDEPPPNASAAEEAVWRRAYETNNRTITERSSATRLQLRAKIVTGRLEALVAEGKLAPERSRHVAGEVNEAWKANVELMTRQWPVDPLRSCRYEHMYFDSALGIAPGRQRTDEVAATRRDLEACLARADSVLKKAAAANRELEEEVVEAERMVQAAESKAASAGSGS